MTKDANAGACTTTKFHLPGVAEMEGVPANEFYCSRRLRRRECGVQPSSHSSWFTSPPTAACEAGKEEFFSPPPHTTGHAGPHPAVHYDEASLVLMLLP